MVVDQPSSIVPIQVLMPAHAFCEWENVANKFCVGTPHQEHGSEYEKRYRC